ncbi:ABC transporter permease [Actinosynnema sp. NPDC023587]|uniref:ABC transporter permease n=1 Tax=Actinosynnema sp. NPDC023587 TaxID=3154695 RepID=UPI0033F7116E
MDTKRPTLIDQFVDLGLMQLSNWRWSWRGMVVTGMVTPLLSALAMGALAKGSGPAAIAHVLTGSIVLALMFENQNKVAQNFSFMKQVGTLDFLATLPVHRFMVIVATVLAFFVLSLPALVVTVVAGSALLGVTLSVSPLVVLVIPLCVLSLAGIGAFIGITARTPEEAGSLTLMATILMLFAGPVVLPPDRLPEWLLRLSDFSPSSYAADAVRQVLIGPVTGRLWLDAGVLAALAALALWFTGFKMQWKSA